MSGDKEINGDGRARPGFDPSRVASELTDLERELLTGTSPHWGSWMFMVGAHLCAKGLGRRRNGSIYLDTPEADAVRAAIAMEAAGADEAAGLGPKGDSAGLNEASPTPTSDKEPYPMSELIARLNCLVPSGRLSLGGGCVGAGGEVKTWGGEPILRLANPDGPEAATRISKLTEALKQCEAIFADLGMDDACILVDEALSDGGRND